MNTLSKHKWLAQWKRRIRGNISDDKGIDKMHGFTKQHWGESHGREERALFCISVCKCEC